MILKSKIRSYTNSFLDIISRQKSSEDIVKSLTLFFILYKKDKYLKSLLSSKRIPLESKRDILYKVFESFINKIVIEFIIILSTDNSIKLLSKIVNNIKKEYQLRNNLVDVKIMSSMDLDEITLEEINDFIKQKDGRTAIISSEIDNDIIGGIKLRVGNTIIDGTIINQLNNLKYILLRSRN